LRTIIVLSAVIDLLIFWGISKVLKKRKSDFQVLLIFMSGFVAIAAAFIVMMYGYAIILLKN
jgi:hypothetical protein